MPETFAPVTLTNDTGQKLNAAYFNRLETSIETFDDRIDALERGVTTPIPVAYAATLTLNVADGSLFRVIAPGNLTLADITGGADGQLVTLEVEASGGDRILTIASQVRTIPSGQRWWGDFRYDLNADKWTLRNDGIDSAGGVVRVQEAPLSLLDPRVNCALDGTGDQAAKVNTAISLLPTAGGHIYQPPGVLRTSAISFDRPVRWEGAGDQASTIQAAAGFTGTLMTISADAPFSRISDVQIAGGGTATTLILVASARARLDHLHLTAAAGTTGAAIWFDGVSTSASAHAAQVSDVRIISCVGYGVYLQGFSYDNEFSNLWIGSCNVGIRYENTNGLFSNAHVWGCTGNGVELRDGNHQFSNCYVETNGGSGFNLFNAARVKLANCNIWKNQGQGVSLSGTSHRFSIVGSQIYDNGGNGIQAADCLHGKVIGCDFYEDTSSVQNQDRPVVTTGTSNYWIITGNTMLTAEHAVGTNSLVGANNVVADNVT